MIRFNVKIEVPDIGPVKHVIIAKSATDASDKAQRAHPKGRVVSCEKTLAQP